MVRKYVKRKQEQQILAELEPGVYLDFIVRANSGDDLYENYTDDYLFALATRYAKVAERESPRSTAARISGSAFAHFGSRYDLTLRKFIEDPRTIALAETHDDTNTAPLRFFTRISQAGGIG